MAIEGFNVSRTSNGGGDTLKSIASMLKVPVDILPLMFSSEMCGDAGSKSMKAFLDGVAAVAFDPLLHFAQDTGIRSCIEASKRAGKTTTKQIVEFCCTTRAASKAPPVPVLPSCPAPTDEQMKVAQDIETAAAAVKAALQTEVNELDATARGLAAVITYLDAKDNYEKLIATASVVDPLPNRRALKALAAASTAAFDGYINLVLATKMKGAERLVDVIHDARNHFQTWVDDSKAQLTKNPEPPSTPALPVLAKEGEASMVQLKELLGEFTTEAVRGLLMGCHASRAELNTRIATANTEFQDAINHRDAINRDRGAWDAYKKAGPEHETAKAKAEAEWLRWDIAAKNIEAAEADNSNKTASQFAELVSEFGTSVLNGRKLTIDRELGVLLNGSSIDVNMSKSEKWRVEVCVMAAIARTVNAPLLIIDAADVLDDRNKPLFIDWVFTKIVPYFKHTILTATVRGAVENEKPFSGINASKFIIHNGEIQKLVNTKE
jgi:hypothetical protein